MKLYQDCNKCCKRSGWVSLFANIGLAVMMAVIGLTSGSKAVMGNALYSLKDALTSAVALIGIKISNKPPDKDHAYGHGKMEYLATFLITILITIGTLFIFVHSMKDIIAVAKGRTIQAPGFIAFWGAVISVAANYKLSRYLECTGEKLHSPAILNNAKHNHSDAISSAFVAGSILGTKMGFYFLDPLAALIESLDLTRMIVVMFKDSINGLMDVSPDLHFIESVRKTAAVVPGVRGVPKVNARNLGRNVWVDLEIKIKKDMPLKEGSRVKDEVKELLSRRFKNLADIQIHLEPYRPA